MIRLPASPSPALKQPSGRFRSYRKNSADSGANNASTAFSPCPHTSQQPSADSPQPAAPCRVSYNLGDGYARVYGVLRQAPARGAGRQGVQHRWPLRAGGRGMPATVCQDCGERSFSREATERARLLVHDPPEDAPPSRCRCRSTTSRDSQKKPTTSRFTSQESGRWGPADDVESSCRQPKAGKGDEIRRRPPPRTTYRTTRLETLTAGP